MYYLCVNKRIITMKAEVGKYKFGRHYNLWGIFSYEEAVREVYHLNGWGTPKYIKRVF